MSTSPSTSGLRGRLLVQQHFTTFLTAELVRLRPHTSIREMLPAIDRAGELYLQLVNRRPAFEQFVEMSQVAYLLARDIARSIEDHALGFVNENAVRVVEHSCGKWR